MTITISGTTGIVADNISDATIQLLQPTGSLLMWVTDTAPTGFLLCDGTTYNEGDYPALFGVIGRTFGGDAGASTFNVPDYRDRMPIGAGTTYSVNDSGGSADAIVVSHTHTITDPGHSHVTTYQYERYDTDGASNQTGGDGLSAGSNLINSNTTGITVDTAGSSGTNANLPPYLGIHFINKT